MGTAACAAACGKARRCQTPPPRQMPSSAAAADGRASEAGWPVGPSPATKADRHPGHPRCITGRRVFLTGWTGESPMADRPRKRQLGLPRECEGQSRLCVQRRTPLREHPKAQGPRRVRSPNRTQLETDDPIFVCIPSAQVSVRRAHAAPSTRILGSSLTQDGQPQQPAGGTGRGP